MIETNMKDKVIIVAGATGGIGTGVVKKLDQSGAITILVGRNETKLRELQNQLQGESYIYTVDFADVEKLGLLFQFLKSENLKADGLVYAAGMCIDMPVKVVDLEDMQAHMQLNYFAYVELCKHFCKKKFSNDGGSIVGFSSISSFLCEKAMSQYAASKAALNAVTETMAKEFADRKIRVNALAPAFVDTEMAWDTKHVRDDFEDYLQEKQPYGMIPVEEIADWTEFLLSDASGHITGEILRISGGYPGM
ncbi:MAG: SDR family oxidoreductase [Lachnospiraceae bacterium]|nr:SDR family oxidoreductase [Lachnospiraceae bacterium]